MDLFSASALIALAHVLMINIVLSGDNAVVIGMVAARVQATDRRRVILWGMGAAVVLRILLAVVAVDLLNILGLLLAGGIILLWVAWRLYRDIREQAAERGALDTIAAANCGAGDGVASASAIPFSRAIWQIAVADISMSVDNVLAIAGAANQNITVLVIGLIVSVALMGVAATYIARLLQQYPALAYIGVALIVYVGFEMIWEGSGDLPELMRFFH
ncbi:MAG TPA: YjbE family putative metal transport protein [Micropepsaceae bacterium]|nr:YjbE family putative metal transport protein [Micropepsaceae bacterium]